MKKLSLKKGVVVTAQRGMFVCGLLINVWSQFKTRKYLKEIKRAKGEGEGSYNTKAFQIKSRKLYQKDYMKFNSELLQTIYKSKLYDDLQNN